MSFQVNPNDVLGKYKLPKLTPEKKESKQHELWQKKLKKCHKSTQPRQFHR